MKTIIGTLILIFLMITKSFSQELIDSVNPAKDKRAFQFTFIYPMGTNGINAENYSNTVSFNLLGGLNGGVGAFELGAFANVNKGDVIGFQAAGFTNVNIGNKTGLQLAGFYNQNNVFNGCQYSGFLNNNIGETHGAQFAGFANVVCNNVKGAQLSGFANVAKDINGAQLTGFINVARKVKGVQLGFINFADSVDGVSIGFLSFVKNGYNRLELGANESLFANLTLKLGTQHFYNIFTSGFKQINNTTYWSYGYGIGTMFVVRPKTNLNIDFISQQVNANHFETNRLNLLNTARLNLSYEFAKHLELVAGPSFNVFVSEFDYKESIGTNSKFVPYCFYDQVHDNMSIKMYVGFNAAIRF